MTASMRFIAYSPLPTGASVRLAAPTAVLPEKSGYARTPISVESRPASSSASLERRLSARDWLVLGASGGVGTLEHLAEGLRIADAALAASIFHDGKHTVQEAKAYLLARGIEVRP